MTGRLLVVKAGFAKVQDAGRTGYAHYGVPRAGAADQFAYRAALALTGHTRLAPVIEVTALDFVCRASIDLTVAVTGAPAEPTVDGRPVPMWRPLTLPAGCELAIRNIRSGLHTYVACGGWLHVPRPLGSAAWDGIMGWGTRLTAGTELEVERTPRAAPRVSLNAADIPRYGSPWAIRVCSGPDASQLGAVWNQFIRTTYQVHPDSNAIGVRFIGPAIPAAGPKEVLSRGAGIGAVEWLPSGLPLALLRGRGVTAGYPIVAVVATVDLDALAQARPLDVVQWVPVDSAEALRAYRRRYAVLPPLTR